MIRRVAHYHQCSACDLTISELSGDARHIDDCLICLDPPEPPFEDFVFCKLCAEKNRRDWPSIERALREIDQIVEETREKFGLQLPVQ